MHVAAITGFEAPESIEIQERKEPTPGSGEAIVDVKAASLNRHDLWILQGDSAMVGRDILPFVTGLDAAGTVSSVGEGVTNLAVGDRVVLCPNQTCGVCRFCTNGPENECEEFDMFRGGLAEQICVDANRLVPLPNDVSATEAASLPTAYVTVWHMLRRAEVSGGDFVFIPGATGGVGVAAVQLADILGSQTIATSGNRGKLDWVGDIGADHLIQSRDIEEITAAVEDVGAPDVVLNHLGGQYTQLGLDVMERSGRMVICGRTTGGKSEIDITDLFLNFKRVLGSTMGTMADLERLVDLVTSGAFSPVVGETYDLEETADAFADMAGSDRFGKPVIQP